MIDLHSHSTASDGSCTPTQLIAMAVAKGLKALALTDHDTVDGLVEFRQAAAGQPVEAIPGIELAACDEVNRNLSYHIVGLFLHRDSPTMKRLLANVILWRNERNLKIIDKLNELGLAITLEEVLKCCGGEVLGRPHIAQALVLKGYVKDSQDAFDKLIATGKPAYVHREVPSPAAAIAAIHSMGGVAIWAHPFTRGNWTVSQTRRMATELKDVGLDGIEAYYALHTPTQVRNALDIAHTVGLLPSGGSDFHGTRFKHLELGTGYGALRVPDELLEPIREKAKRN